MKHGIAALILIMTAAAGNAFAAQDTLNLASIDRQSNLPLKNITVAPAVIENYDYYEVRGANEKDLRCQMTQNGCKWTDGKKYDSVTTWHVKWDYGYGQTPQSCSAESFRATVEITFRYPRWVSTDDAPKPLAAKWDTYMKNLIVHENGHRDMAVEAAADLTRAVANLPVAPTCAEIDREVRALCSARMKKLNADEKKYDDATAHGKTQGALFP